MCDATIVGHFSFDSPVRQDSLLLQEDNRSRLLSDHVSSEARGTFVVLKVSFAKQGRTFPPGLLKYSFAGEVGEMSSFLYLILPALGGYTLTSVYLLKNPHILHKRKRTAFYCTHISHRGGKTSARGRALSRRWIKTWKKNICQSTFRVSRNLPSWHLTPLLPGCGERIESTMGAFTKWVPGSLKETDCNQLL